MRFSSLSPADRLKAGGLAGLIVIVLFFLVHSMLGAVSPKRATAPNPPDGAVAAAADPSAPGPMAPAAPGDPKAAVEPPAVASGAKAVTGLGIQGMDMHDPFVPIRDLKKPLGFAPAPAAHAASTAPDISVHGALPGPSTGPSASSGPGEFGFSPVGPAAAPPPPPAPEPEIRVVGFIHGDTAVATLQVAGRSMLCRPGDFLAKGYRLVRVTAESVAVRHGKAVFILRTGEAINEVTKLGPVAPRP